MALVRKWQKSDERRTRVAERQMGGAADADLVASNSYLRALNRTDSAQH
jgi:hypothetical protein